MGLGATSHYLLEPIAGVARRRDRLTHNRLTNRHLQSFYLRPNTASKPQIGGGRNAGLLVSRWAQTKLLWGRHMGNQTRLIGIIEHAAGVVLGYSALGAPAALDYSISVWVLTLGLLVLGGIGWLILVLSSQSRALTRLSKMSANQDRRIRNLEREITRRESQAG